MNDCKNSIFCQVNEKQIYGNYSYLCKGFYSVKATGKMPRILAQRHGFKILNKVANDCKTNK
ncbi:hypothetical protein [uncultured Gammaproteobacteria bacterium]|uniref:hypothetical protein n=1 Tax=Bathymodiolus heckerae thiotrophic gill symbiont TaxID=1052212 RepID=UPI0010FE2B5A|nr:hypothetical protein [Bathymodiolus heckerae thiotrophic gill symbiont]CAC9443419.1 hypothetical protein [uncultured Gammaproteobacteria bacterium]